MGNMQIIVVAAPPETSVAVTYEIITFARAVRAYTGGWVKVLVMGNRVTAAARQIACDTGVTVTGIASASLALYNGEAYLAAVMENIESNDGPVLICLPHISFGFDLAPRLAVSLEAACITAVEKMRFVGDEMRLIRPMFNGRLKAELAVSGQKAVVTITPGAWPGAHSRSVRPIGASRPAELPEPPESTEYPELPGRRGKVRIVAANISTRYSQTLEIKESAGQRLDLSDAEVIVAAGRGIGDPDNIQLLKDLAGIFPRPGLGASRAVCDLGWLGYPYQIGITGQTVAPGLYIACGISGASQHLAGMRHSRMIVAINIDPHAAIFQVADYCIVENLETFIPVLLDVFHRLSSKDTEI